MHIIDAILMKVIVIISSLGYWGVGLGMLIESCNIPLPSEVVLPLGGYLVSTGQLTFWGAVAAGTIGGTIGSVISYYIGLLAGRPFLFKYGRYLGIGESKIIKGEQYFARYGEITVLFTRLLPVVRTFISLPAGMAGMNFSRFVIYTIIGSIPWSIALVYAGFILGQNWQALKPWFHRMDLVVIVLLLGLVVFYWQKKKLKQLS
ncbi:DedA family protein [Desulfotomaculum nigrificans]|uniref:DedA family protein n=1 Tax=Desulfotomaculum nigrificans TaxID=1565 RepID=UPI0001FAF226|nr:DedA family protein [Desulfotomaculum nigrificans]